MVYLGKPSQGCQMCKTRRIKCDETKPFCNQCIKSRRECPGYKDPFDVVFRNETQATERRARKASIKTQNLRAGRESGDSSPHTSQPRSNKASPSNSIAVSPTQPVADRAKCHFIANFIMTPPQGTERGYFEYLLPILNDKPPLAFKLAFEACCLASLGNRVGTGRDFEKQALGKYTASLAAISTAIRDPVLSKTDGVLAAVLLLGLFESITSRHVGMLAWGTHTEGAIQLVKGRGREQFQTKQGRDLWGAVRTQAIIYAFSSGKAPALGADFWIKGAAKDKFATLGQHITLRIGELRTKVNMHLSSPGRRPDQLNSIIELVKQCQARDQELIEWAQNLPDYFEFKTVHWQSNVPNGDLKKSEIYPGRVDAYQDLWVGVVVNTMRCSRLVVASMIMRCAAWLCYPADYRTTPEYATYSRISEEVISDIIASLPYQLGWFATRKHLLDRPDLPSYACGQDDTPKMLAGYFITWPLSCVMTQDCASDNQRIWAQGRLEAIATDLGVRYAKMLTHLNLRVPSMLIRRDIDVATGGAGSATDFEKILSTRAFPPSGLAVSPTPHRAVDDVKIKVEDEV